MFYRVMKANEMPERIYLFDYNNAMVTPLEGDTTYVREDAFIEKALKFIKTNIDRIVNNQHGVCMGCMDVEFRKYMKGE